MCELTEKRLKLGLNKVQMARLMGVPYVTWEKWESGERNMSKAPLRLLDMIEVLNATNPVTFKKLKRRYIGKSRT